MRNMRLPWSKSGNLQLDLLDAPAAPEAATAPPVAPGAAARSPSMVPRASLYEDTNNPRTEIPDAELDELTDDIRQHGILQPIVVHRADREGQYQIHFGATRWRAAQRIGLYEVPVVVRDGPTNPYAQVAENQKRHGLTPLELARFIRGRIDAGDSNTRVARILGMDLRLTRAKRLRAKLHAVKDELRRRMHRPIAEQGQYLRAVVGGQARHFAVPCNGARVQGLRFQVTGCGIAACSAAARAST
jgi:ParB/RepB/Spo0J family partition protein